MHLREDTYAAAPFPTSSYRLQRIVYHVIALKGTELNFKQNYY